MKLDLTHRAIGVATVAMLTLLSGCGNKTEEPAAMSSKAPMASSSAAPKTSTSPASGAAKTPAGTKPGDPAQGKVCAAPTAVKGNIGKEKIYHLPGTQGYDLVKAEECFKDAASAEKAGYRAPK
jgi:hypothetical protein